MNLANTTIRGYDFIINRLKRYMSDKGISELEQVDKYFMQGYLSYLSSQVSKTSVKDYYITLNVFFNYLATSGLLPVNPLADISKPKGSKRLARSFTPQELKLIFDTIDKSSFLGYRDYTILSILLGTGIRKSELIGLRSMDIYLEISMIKIIGKGDKQRNIPLTELLRKIIVKYLKLRMEYISERGLSNSSYLIINEKGNRFGLSGINSMFKRIKDNSGVVGERVSSHTIRHTFAKSFLLNGGDIFTLQRLMGHEDISTTKKYISLNDNDIRVQNDRYNPLENDRWRYF
jgi:site-specific recombinase XerD